MREYEIVPYNIVKQIDVEQLKLYVNKRLSW